MLVSCGVVLTVVALGVGGLTALWQQRPEGADGTGSVERTGLELPLIVPDDGGADDPDRHAETRPDPADPVESHDPDQDGAVEDRSDDAAVSGTPSGQDGADDGDAGAFLPGSGTTGGSSGAGGSDGGDTGTGHDTGSGGGGTTTPTDSPPRPTADPTSDPTPDPTPTPTPEPTPTEPEPTPEPTPTASPTPTPSGSPDRGASE